MERMRPPTLLLCVSIHAFGALDNRHHIDHYVEDEGRTDVDRGILLCRYHHMQLHHGGWKITRDGLGDFLLHPPPGRGEPITLPPRLALRYAWGDIDPPPKRSRPAA